jgi:signal transduction histidine kinase
MRLIQRTIRLYSLLSFCVLAIGIPVFYVLLQTVVRQEVDEELLVNKSQLIQRLNRQGTDLDPSQYNFLDKDITIRLNQQVQAGDPDHFSAIARYDSVIDETIHMRLLKTTAIIHGNAYLITLTAPMVDHDDLIEIVLIVQVVLLALLFIGLWVINKNVSAAYLLQKEFTENAAHEMQTPLAVFQSKLELLMQTSPFNDTQAELIGKMADASQRLNKLNKALVLLMRIQNQQFADVEKIDVVNVIDHLLDQYSDAIIQKNLTVTFNKLSPVKIDSNKALMEILLGNLLSNAIRHNFEDGSIRIQLFEKEVIIENSGPAKALNAVKLFKRFQKDSINQNSLGLGLEIIDKICTLNHFTLKYHYADQKHIFVIRF